MELKVTEDGIVNLSTGIYVAWVGMDGKLHFVGGLKKELDRWLADVCRKYPFNFEVDKDGDRPARI